jgi:uncharacterized protein (TIGR03435 family)
MKSTVIALGIAASALCAQQPPRFSFDVASIRPHEGPLSRIADFSISGPRVTYSGYNPFLLILEAYNLRNYQVSVPPDKLSMDDYYEIAALAPGSGTVMREEFRRMLQSLLADRFKLRFHREAREIAVYELVVDKKGPSLKAGKGDNPCASLIGPVHPQDRNYRYQFTNCTLDRLVNNLQVDRPVLDKTGLTGRYDMTISATPDFKMRDSSESGDISMRDAVKQLGLRLDARKAEIEVFVLDHMERPTGN